MKYIRTEGNEIISYDENASALDKPLILFYKDKYREADDIEELFDEIVYVPKADSHPCVTHSIKHPSYADYYEVYGAIWTKRGLIYVAKLNEKGEWELL